MSSSLPRTKIPRSAIFGPNQLLWALIGLLLTIGGTFVEVSTANPPWHWAENGIQPHPLGVTCQIGAVLLVGCLGGQNSALLSQIAYVLLGLVWLPVFSQGGGLAYLAQPTFGYLLGFIPGAWVCGWLAFRQKARLESLALSCLNGLLAIHLVGITYLIGLQLFNPSNRGIVSLLESIWKYSLAPLPGQLAIVCAVSVLAFLLRQILFY